MLNNNNNNGITIYTITYVIFIIIFGIAAAYYSFKYVNKDQNMQSRIFVSFGAFFMNIGYFIKIIILKLIGYKWYGGSSPVTNIETIANNIAKSINTVTNT